MYSWRAESTHHAERLLSPRMISVNARMVYKWVGALVDEFEVSSFSTRWPMVKATKNSTASAVTVSSLIASTGHLVVKSTAINIYRLSSLRIGSRPINLRCQLSEYGK